MQIYQDIHEKIPQVNRGVALGFFDGVHQGHLELLRTLLYHSREKKLQASAFTFPNHPDAFFVKKNSFSGYLCSLDERLHELEMCGLPEIHFQAFDQTFASLPAEAFLDTYIKQRLNAKLVIAGSDYRFGQGGHGDAAYLVKWAAANGIDAVIVPDVCMAGNKVSSSRIREAIRQGDLELTGRLLGHPYRITGVVVSGRGLGQKIGFPTANMIMPDDRVCPSYGVYATRTSVDGRVYDSITNVGIRPTIEHTSVKPLVETYLYGTDMNLYGKTLAIEFLAKTRDEKKFRSLLQLTNHISQDLAEVKAWHQSSELICQRAKVNGIALNWLPTARFSQSVFSLVFRCPMDRQLTSASLLLTRILTASCKRYPTRPALASALDSLYGAHLDANLEKQGDMQSIIFSAVGLQRWTDGTSPFADVVSLLFELLLDPLLDEQGDFDHQITESERANLMMEWKARENDRLKYAYDSCMREICGEQPQGISALGDPDLISQISQKDLKQAYKDLLHQMQIDCFVGSGGNQPGLLDNIISNLGKLPKESRPVYRPGFAPSKFVPAALVVRTETKDLAQAKIIQAYHGLPPYFSSQVMKASMFNSMLGGEVHSLLFEVVREQMGLAYQVFSMNQRYLSIVFMLAGVAPENVSQAKEAMQAQIKKLASGQFSDQLFVRSQKMLRASVLSMQDDLGSMMSHQMSALTHGRVFSLDDMLSLLEQVTKEDVMQIAAELRQIADYTLTSHSRSSEVSTPDQSENRLHSVETIAVNQDEEGKSNE